jgi:hypothetical protein
LPLADPEVEEEVEEEEDEEEEEDKWVSAVCGTSL